MLTISFIAPVIATIVSTINFFLVTWNFRGKPWNFKYWLILSMFSWIPWAGFTVLLRLAPSEQLALLYLQISYVTSYITFYSLFRFHNQLDIKRDKKFLTFFMAIFMGINVALGVNPDYLNVVKTGSGMYYTDTFSPTLFFLHVGFTLILAFLVFRVLREIQALSIFYSSSGKGTSKLFVFAGLLLVLVDISLLVFFFISDGSPDATSFLLFSVLVTTFLGITYGIKPLSSILSPQRLWTFFIISHSGLPIYEYHFSGKEKIGELALVSGAINASNTTIMDYIDSKHPVQEVELDDRVIVIENSHNMMFCIVADNNTQQMQLVHKEVVKGIVNHNEFSIDKHGFHNIKNFDFIDRLVENGFSSKSQEVLS